MVDKDFQLKPKFIRHSFSGKYEYELVGYIEIMNALKMAIGQINWLEFWEVQV